jgi:hypothetical protein
MQTNKRKQWWKFVRLTKVLGESAIIHMPPLLTERSKTEIRVQ